MEHHSSPPQWLETLAWISLIAAFASTAYIVYDIYVRRYPQRMRIMEIVYPVTALYFGPTAVWFYRRHGRRKLTKIASQPAAGGESPTIHTPDQHAQSSRDRHSDDRKIRWHQTAEADTCRPSPFRSASSPA